MANEEQLEILAQGVGFWNKWRKDNPDIEIYLWGVNLCDIDLNFANLSGADLSYTHLWNAKLAGANLTGANLTGAQLINAFLNNADLSNANLYRADLSDASLKGTNLSNTNLTDAKFNAFELLNAKHIALNLEGFNFEGCNLNEKDLTNVNFTNTNLVRVQALGTSFNSATLTGACIQDWNINSETNFDNVICDYIYLKEGKQERRPADPNRNFEPGDFAKLVQKSLETVDLIFKDGIDWRAFLSSYQDIQVEYGDQNVSIQAIEKKQDGAFVIRLNAPSDVDKGEIESKVKQSYETQLKLLEADNHRLLQHNASLENIVNTLASRPIIVQAKAVVEKDNTSNQFNAPVGSVGNQGTQTNVTGVVEGDQIGTQHNYAPQPKTLAEAAAEIQQLLNQLSKTYPTSTTTEQMVVATEAIKRIESNPSFKQRVINAAKEGGLAAFEKALDSTPGAFITGAVRGWLEAEA